MGRHWLKRTSGRCASRPSANRLLALARVVLPQVAEAGRDVARLAQGHAGPLRVAVQCHNCFDWLMPAMDAYRTLWPEVELDIISGFVVDPLPLLEQGEAELAVIHDRHEAHPTIAFSPLFRYESVALMSPRHRLAAKPWLRSGGFRSRNPDHLSRARRDAGRDEALSDAREGQSQAAHR